MFFEMVSEHGGIMLILHMEYHEGVFIECPAVPIRRSPRRLYIKALRPSYL